MGISARMSERIALCFCNSRVPQQPHKSRVKKAPSSLFMRACDPGRHFLGYFFVAADKEVTRHKGETTNQKNNNLNHKKRPGKNQAFFIKLNKK